MASARERLARHARTRTSNRRRASAPCAGSASAGDEQPVPFKVGKAVAKGARFTVNFLARLALCIASPAVREELALEHGRRSRAEIDVGAQKKSVWSEGGRVERDFHDLSVIYIIPKGVEHIRDSANKPVEFKVNNLWEEGDNNFYSGTFLKKKYNENRSEYAKCAEKFNRSGQNDPSAFPNFVKNGVLSVMFYHYVVKDLAPLPGGQSLTRGLPAGFCAAEGCGETTDGIVELLPAGCGAAEGCGETTDGIVELPKRKNRRVLEPPDENLGALVKVATGYFQRSSEPPKAASSKANSLHQAGRSIVSLMMIVVRARVADFAPRAANLDRDAVDCADDAAYVRSLVALPVVRQVAQRGLVGGIKA